jgi:hypothetical protein
MFGEKKKYIYFFFILLYCRRLHSQEMRLLSWFQTVFKATRMKMEILNVFNVQKHFLWQMGFA